MKIFFANVDNKSECVPIASSLTSVVDIFIKVGLLFAKKETITKSCYYEHLASKSFKRCILLAVPIIGNITVGLYDKYKEVDWDNFNEALRAVKKDGTQLSQANNLLKKNTFIVEAAIENNPLALEHADENFRDNQTLINKIRDSAFENKKAALKFASAEQQLRLLREGFFKLDEVADEHKNNINFLVATYTFNFKYIDPAYQEQGEFKEALENARQNNKN